MRRFVTPLVAAVAVMIASLAEAQVTTNVITFDELVLSTNPILGSVVCSSGSGFRFYSDHFHVVSAFPQDYSYDGTSSLGYESGRGFPITMERVGAGTFSLRSLNAAEFYAVQNADRPNAETLMITGVQQGGGIVTHTVTLDGVHDGPGGVADFEHFVLPGTFVNLTSVVFTGLRAGGLSGGVSVDAIEYQVAAPETLPPCQVFPLESTAPTVSIASPAAGNVAGAIPIQATAAGAQGIASVQFMIDGVNLGAADTSAPYSTTWDTTTVIDGPHTITAEARDTVGATATASVVVTVRNSPVNTTDPHFIDLDGVNDYVEIPDTNVLSFGNGVTDTPLTVELWFRPDAMGRHQLLGKGFSGATQEYKLHIASGYLRFDLTDASSGATVSALTANSFLGLIGGWHHLAATYDGRGGATAANGITLYVDGAVVPVTRVNNAAYVAMENLSAPVQIGRESPSWRQYDGGLDEIRLWNVAHTLAEIQTFMPVEISGSEPGLVGYWRFNEGQGSSVLDDSPNEHSAQLFNGPVWVAGGPLAPAAPDTTAPVISGIVASGLTATGVTIGFATNEPATGWVSYWVGASCPCTDVYSAAVGTTHSVTLTGLTPSTTYNFAVRATDAANNLQTSAAASFSTPALPVDTTAPSVTFTSPAAGPVSGAVALQATATDAVGVVQVQFKVNGVNQGAADATAPYGIVWDTTAVANGAYTLTAEARDAANNIGTATVLVTVSNGPVVTTPHHVTLDGVNDYVDVADADALSFGNGATDTPLTVELWFRPDAMGRHQLLGKGFSGATQEYKLHIASGYIRFDLRDASAGVTVSALTANSFAGLVGGWHHLAATYDGRGGATAANGITLYVDGVAVPVSRVNNAAYVAMENLSAPVQIGRESPSWQQYGGGLDEIRLWNVARSAAEIQAFMNTTLGGADPGLVAYWRFDEGTGTTVTDSSPASYTATLVNGPVWVAGGPLP